MKVYKLTDRDGRTHGGYQWSLPRDGKPGDWHQATGTGVELCSNGYLHYYADPLLALLHNPVHADIQDPLLWEAEADGEMLDDNGMKGGAKRMRLIAPMEPPKITTEQRVAYGILCAKEVCDDPGWNQWADRWLSGEDRSGDDAARAAEAWAEEAVWAVWAARAAEAWAEEAVWATRAAAWAAARAAAWAAAIDLITLAKKAMEY